MPSKTFSNYEKIFLELLSMSIHKQFVNGRHFDAGEIWPAAFWACCWPSQRAYGCFSEKTKGSAPIQPLEINPLFLPS